MESMGAMSVCLKCCKYKPGWENCQLAEKIFTWAFIHDLKSPILECAHFDRGCSCDHEQFILDFGATCWI